MELDSTSPVSELADYIEGTGLEYLDLVDEYRYASLPVCVIDAVFSIGVRYTHTQRVVENFCSFSGWTRFAESRNGRGEGEHGINELIDLYAENEIEGMTERVFQNRQRTSPRSGILKSEAVLRFCEALASAGINHFTDINQERREAAEVEILRLPGQSSGISFDYFQMLAGDDNLVKADRMVQRYIRTALSLDREPPPRQAALLVRLASEELNRRGHRWTPLSLDYAIWKSQSKTPCG